MTNVVEFDHPDSPSPEELRERDQFNALYSEYLKVRSKLVREGLSDEECDALCDQHSYLVWRIIRTPTPANYQLGYKFEIMREMADGRWLDGRHLAMIESIYLDVIEPW